MSHIEYEIRVLEIDVDDVKKKLNELGAKLVFDVLQKRYVYDFNPVLSNKWIRLRTNGKETTLTIKDVSEDKVDGTKELEIVVDDFDTTNEILGELGYKPRGVQENKRIRYDLNGVEVDIDTWPGIPTYLEIEGKSEKEVFDTLESLGFSKDEATALNTQDIYEKIYNYDKVKVNYLSFDNF